MLDVVGAGGVLGGLGDLGHELEVELVGELEHRGRVAGLGGGALDGVRAHALGEHRHALVDHEADDPRGVEAAAVVDDDRRLADLLDDVVGLGQRDVGGLLALDDLDQRHLVDGAEEVQADEVLRAVDAGGELGDRQRGGVGAEQRVGVHVLGDLGEHLVLERGVLEDGLDDEVAAGEVGRVGGGGDAAEQLGLLLLGGAALGDRLVEQGLAVGLALLGVGGLDVLEDDVHAGLGAHVGDAGAHHPGAEDADLGGLPRLDALRAERAGVDRLQVEEERLDHVLRALVGDQLGEVARLDPRGGVEVAARALHRGAEDRAGGGVDGALGLLAQQRRERRQERGQRGGLRVAAGHLVAGGVPRVLVGVGVGLDPRLRGRARARRGWRRRRRPGPSPWPPRA